MTLSLPPCSVSLLLCDVRQPLAGNQSKLHLKRNVPANRLDFAASVACVNVTAAVAAVSYKDAGTGVV